jgi:selenide,water dikinase
LCGLEYPTDSNLIVGLERADDAGVYKITDDIAIIQTVDFFTPIVDDPYWFGQIAVANALSDVYAMGGEPRTAMNLVGFPLKKMDISILRQILQGGLDKMREANVVLVGGHSVEDDELKYGLAVTGFVHPERILLKTGLAPGDRLILTKPLGTGIINTAIKGGLASDAIINKVSRVMATLNKDAAEIMLEYPVHACTDITGFGLLGHISEMVAGSAVGVRIMADRLPVFPEASEYAAMGLIPAGMYKNREYYDSKVKISPVVDQLVQDLLFDPQTSGGLLIGVEK